MYYVVTSPHRAPYLLTVVCGGSPVADGHHNSSQRLVELEATGCAGLQRARQLPEQQFPVLLDTNSIGLSLLRCKPCTSGSNDCDPAFDTSRSSTFAHVL
jgi:hypothetical protein